MKNKGIWITTAILLMLVIVVLPVNAMQLFSGDRTGEGANPGGKLNQENTEESPAPSGGRPQIVVGSYYTEPGAVQAGGEFTLFIELKNRGQEDARDVNLVFSAANFSPLETGGVLYRQKINEGGEDGDRHTFQQKFYAAPGLWGYTVEPLTLTVSYVDDYNLTSHTDTFNISIPLEPPKYIQPSATPTVSVSRPRLLVTKSTSDVEVLQPGTQFELFLDISNLGSETARNVNLVVGGATVPAVPEGTDTPGGSYTASDGDFTHFSPLGGSNIQALGDIALGTTFTTSQPLIVNVTTTPGAYALKISLVYQDSQGRTLVDDQVITLLVKSVPMVGISFYREPGDLFAYQPNMLPLQIVNVGKSSAVLSNVKVTASSGTIENGSMTVGLVETSYPFTFDPMFTPDMPGEVTLTITVDYVDDFNQPQVITQELTVNVIEMEMPAFTEEPGMEVPVDLPPANETFWQKAWRFIKGLLGLDSSSQEPGMETIPEMPLEGGIIDDGGGVIQVMPGG